MAGNWGIFSFPARERLASVGRVVVGTLAMFTNGSGRIASSPVAVDDAGNVTTPGEIDAGTTTDGAARASTTGTGVNHWATFGNSSAPEPAFKQRVDGVAAVDAVTAFAVGVDARTPFYASEDGVRANGPLGGNTGPAPSMALQVSGGFLFAPRLSAANRDALTTSGALGASEAGAFCYNTDAARLEMWDGAAWVGFTTVP
jgi:hypothetical protein